MSFNTVVEITTHFCRSTPDTSTQTIRCAILATRATRTAGTVSMGIVGLANVDDVDEINKDDVKN